jgi:uncharacterized protein
MSKSRPRPLITVRNSKPRQSENTKDTGDVHQYPGGSLVALKRKTAALSRWLHIYLSMISFAILFFFAATGLTLNHLEWFGDQQQAHHITGMMEAKWVNDPDTSKIAKLEVVEYLRATHAIKGGLRDFLIDDAECAVSFKGPGYSADIYVNRKTGTYDMSELRMGFIAVANDLHKGRDAGKTWSLVIDISALLMAAVSLTGIVMVFFIRRKRVNGLALAVLGAVISLAIYYYFVKYH